MLCKYNVIFVEFFSLFNFFVLFDDYYKRFILTTRDKCKYTIFYYKTILKNNVIYFLCKLCTLRCMLRYLSKC